MNLEGMLVTAAKEIAEELIERAAKGKPLVGIRFEDLVEKSRCHAIQRQAMREAAERRIAQLAPKKGGK